MQLNEAGQCHEHFITTNWLWCFTRIHTNTQTYISFYSLLQISIYAYEKKKLESCLSWIRPSILLFSVRIFQIEIILLFKIHYYPAGTHCKIALFCVWSVFFGGLFILFFFCRNYFFAFFMSSTAYKIAQ